MKLRKIRHYDIKEVYNLFLNGSISTAFEPCDLLDFTAIVDEWKLTGQALLGEIRNEIVAACQISRGKYRASHCAHISFFAVRTPGRIKGEDKAFLKSIVNALKDNGITRIDLAIGEDDISALNFFTENGFSIEARLDHLFYCPRTRRYWGGYLMAAVFFDNEPSQIHHAPGPHPRSNNEGIRISSICGSLFNHPAS